jgi:hypothetical protein
MKLTRVLFGFAAAVNVLIFAECLSAVEEPSPILCTPAVKLGQSRDSIEDTWGKPDEIIVLEPDEIGLEREVWVYTTKPFGILIDNAYVCKTQKLVFSGKYLTDIISGEDPLPYKEIQREIMEK